MRRPYTEEENIEEMKKLKCEKKAYEEEKAVKDWRGEAEANEEAEAIRKCYRRNVCLILEKLMKVFISVSVKLIENS